MQILHKTLFFFVMELKSSLKHHECITIILSFILNYQSALITQVSLSLFRYSVSKFK